MVSGSLAHAVGEHAGHRPKILQAEVGLKAHSVCGHTTVFGRYDVASFSCSLFLLPETAAT